MSVNPPYQHHEPAPSTFSGPVAATPSPTLDGRTASEHHPVARIDSAATATARPLHMHDNAAGDAETLLPYPPLDDDPSQAQTLLPPAHFSPFFTLVEDADTGEHHHPAVHYVFSDDDPDLHTAVFMRALGDTTTAPSSPTAVRHPHHPLHDASGHGIAAEAADHHIHHILPPPPAPGVKQRYVVVDLGADGQAVAGATSLSREWQVVGASTAPAPSFAEDSSEDAATATDSISGGALMLRIEGTDMSGNNNISSNRGGAPAEAGQQQGEEEAAVAAAERLGEVRKTAGDDLVSGLEELLRRFDGGVDVLTKVVGPDVDVLVQQQQGGDGGDEVPLPSAAGVDVLGGAP